MNKLCMISVVCVCVGVMPHCAPIPVGYDQYGQGPQYGNSNEGYAGGTEKGYAVPSEQPVYEPPPPAQTVIVHNTYVRYDTVGVPIFGYVGPRPIYGYSSVGVPIFSYNMIGAGCYVPPWRSAPYYRGNWHVPRGAHFGHPRGGRRF